MHLMCTWVAGVIAWQVCTQRRVCDDTSTLSHHPEFIFIQFVPTHNASIPPTDEHYVASLLVSLGQEHECNCVSVSFSDWGQGGAHPRSWTTAELNTSTLQFMRCGWCAKMHL